MNLDESKFIEDLINTDFSLQSGDSDKYFFYWKREFSKIVEKNAPFRNKLVRGNHAHFMNKELRKAIYTKSRLRNNFYKVHRIRTRLFIRGGPRTAATSKTERFAIIVNGWKRSPAPSWML